MGPQNSVMLHQNNLKTLTVLFVLHLCINGGLHLGVYEVYISGAFLNLRKTNINYISVRPSPWNNTAPTAHTFVKYRGCW